MSNCNVCIGTSDYDGSFDFYRCDTPKARKDHRCLECRTVIAKGSLYDLFVAKFDGDFSAQKTCLPCAEIRRTYSCGQAEPIGELWSEMRDHGFQDFRMAGECWDSLSAPAKAKLLDKWREWKGLTV